MLRHHRLWTCVVLMTMSAGCVCYHGISENRIVFHNPDPGLRWELHQNGERMFDFRYRKEQSDGRTKCVHFAEPVDLGPSEQRVKDFGDGASGSGYVIRGQAFYLDGSVAGWSRKETVTFRRRSSYGRYYYDEYGGRNRTWRAPKEIVLKLDRLPRRRPEPTPKPTVSKPTEWCTPDCRHDSHEQCPHQPAPTCPVYKDR